MRARADEQANVVNGIERTERFGDPITEHSENVPPPDYPAAPEAETPPDDYEPLAVRVVEGEDRSVEPMDWNGRRVYVDDARPVKVVGRNINRRRLVIRNDDATNPVYLGRTENESVSSMFELAADESGANRAEIEMTHQSEVWAICDSGGTALLSIMAEYIPQEKD